MSLLLRSKDHQRGPIRLTSSSTILRFDYIRSNEWTNQRTPCKNFYLLYYLFIRSTVCSVFSLCSLARQHNKCFAFAVVAYFVLFSLGPTFYSSLDSTTRLDSTRLDSRLAKSLSTPATGFLSSDLPGCRFRGTIDWARRGVPPVLARTCVTRAHDRIPGVWDWL